MGRAPGSGAGAPGLPVIAPEEVPPCGRPRRLGDGDGILGDRRRERPIGSGRSSWRQGTGSPFSSMRKNSGFFSKRLRGSNSLIA